MKSTFLILLLAAGTAAASAQAPAKAPAAAAKPATATAKPTPAAVKLPLGVPVPGVPAVTTVKKTAFSLQYQEIKVGDGADAEAGKLYTVKYKGWLGNNGRADDGRMFDTTDDHRMPVKDKDGKPVMDTDGKPKLGDPQPYQFLQGVGAAGRGPFPGFDQGFDGMKVGGHRRIFVPWQLAYGTHEVPGRDADHPGIPAKSNMIFDVELVAVSDLPPQQPHPGMMQGGRPMPGSGGMPAGHPPVGMPPTPPTPPAPSTAPNAAAPSAAPAPPAPPTAAPAPQK
jgi:peptidylprolyl isomerase